MAASTACCLAMPNQTATAPIHRTAAPMTINHRRLASLRLREEAVSALISHPLRMPKTLQGNPPTPTPRTTTEHHIWDVERLEPDASQAPSIVETLILVVEHPSLAGLDGLTSVQVGYRPPDTEVGIRLQGEWGDGHLLDNGGDNTDLWVQGVLAEPEDFAQLAATWMERQLRRPLERLEWMDGDRVVASRVRLTNGGQILVRKGAWVRTIRRGPDRVTRLNG